MNLLSHPSFRQDVGMQTLRGLACFLLVAYHVVGSQPDVTGLRLQDGHPLHDLNDVLSYLRMPLFTFISGYVYCYRPLAGSMGRYWYGKLRRLGYPLIFVGGLFALVQCFTPGTNGALPWHQFWTVYVFPYAHFWYLQALLVVFALFGVLEYTGLTRRPQTLWLSFGISCLILPVRDVLPSLFSLYKAFYLLPYFLLGVLYFRVLQHVFQRHRRLVRLCLGIGLLGYLAFGGVLAFAESYSYRSLGFSCLLLLAATLLNPQSHVLALVGQYSYAIYLFHVFFSAATRLAFDRVGLEGVYLNFICGLGAGVLGPVLLYKATGRFSTIRLLLFGQSSRRPALPLLPERPPVSSG